MRNRKEVGDRKGFVPDSSSYWLRNGKAENQEGKEKCRTEDENDKSKKWMKSNKKKEKKKRNGSCKKWLKSQRRERKTKQMKDE